MINLIGSKLKMLRRGKKLTQQDVADKIGSTRSTISNYEINRRTPHLKELQKFCALYGVGLDYFGIAETDEAFDLLTRARDVFESDTIPDETKEVIYHEMMKLYLSLQDEKSGSKNLN